MLASLGTCRVSESSGLRGFTILASLGTCRVGDGDFRDLQTAESAKPRGPVRLSSRIGESEVEGPAELVNPVVARIVCMYIKLANPGKSRQKYNSAS